MKYYDKDYRPTELSHFVSYLIAIFAFVTFAIFKNNFIRAILFSYFLIGSISDLSVNLVIGNIWSRESLKDVKEVNNKLISDLKKVSWLPRTVGIFERIIFTTSFIIGRYEFVAIWLGLKVIGSWKDNGNKELWRIRENIFLIGTALSLILSFISAVCFLKIKN